MRLPAAALALLLASGGAWADPAPDAIPASRFNRPPLTAPSAAAAPEATEAPEDRAAAAAVGFVAALFAHDCGYIARQVAYPADMGGAPAAAPADIIPPDACDPAAATASPLEVLADEGLEPVGVTAAPLAFWLATAPPEEAAAARRAGGRAEDWLVEAAFARDDGATQRARVLLTAAAGSFKVRGYWD